MISMMLTLQWSERPRVNLGRAEVRLVRKTRQQGHGGKVSYCLALGKKIVKLLSRSLFLLKPSNGSTIAGSAIGDSNNDFCTLAKRRR